MIYFDKETRQFSIGGKGLQPKIPQIYVADRDQAIKLIHNRKLTRLLETDPKQLNKYYRSIGKPISIKGAVYAGGTEKAGI